MLCNDVICKSLIKTCYGKVKVILKKHDLNKPSRHLRVQIQQWKHQGNVCNLFKVNCKDTSMLSWSRSGVSIVNSEQVSHIVLLFPLFTLNKEMSARKGTLE